MREIYTDKNGDRQDVPVTTVVSIDSSGNEVTNAAGENVVNTVAEVSNFNVSGNETRIDVWGLNGSLSALTAGTGKGPDTFIVDVSEYATGRCFINAVLETGTIEHTVTVGWSEDGVAGNVHDSGTSVWSAQTDNQGAVLTILDNFAHITVSQGAGTAEDMWIYINGREIA